MSIASRKDSIRKHATRSWACPVCKKLVRGNGGKTSHQRAHVRAGTGLSAWINRFAGELGIA